VLALHPAQRGPTVELGNRRFTPHPGLTPSKAGFRGGLHQEQLGGIIPGVGPIQGVDRGCVLVHPRTVTMSQREGQE
jgi:hypothetical protein